MSEPANNQTGVLSFVFNYPPHELYKNSMSFNVQLWTNALKLDLGTYGLLPTNRVIVNRQTNEYAISVDLDSLKNIANNIYKSLEYQGFGITVEFNNLISALTKIHERHYNLNLAVIVTSLPDEKIEEIDEKIIKDISNTFTINNVTEVNVKELVEQNERIINLLTTILSELKNQTRRSSESAKTTFRF
jgi:hypothetical protein